MATETADEVTSPADGHAPPYHYDAAHGYSRPEDSNVQPHQQQYILNPEANSEDESLYDSSADDISDSELADANPQDYTKSYNRQRRQVDPSIPVDQKPKTNPQKPKANVSARIDDQLSSLSKHASKLKLNSLSAGMGGKDDAKGDKDRADRATSEQVLDPRTRMILLQMVNRGVVSEVNGCVSTGKEANVYHALTDSAQSSAESTELPYPVAIKIFKTAILTFKARSAYLEGEFRFKSGFKHRSNHAMVRMWAEKEFRNLKRLHAAGLPVPEPLYLKAHVLVMRFVGSKKGWSAPLLRDVVFAEDEAEAQWKSLYHQVLRSMRIIYQQCRLVHADLSEYNMLFNAGRLWIIDVGQAVEHDHPRSLEFLRTDVKNITRFFATKSIATLPEQAVFNFIVTEKGSIDESGMEKALEALEKLAIDQANDLDGEAKLESDTAVFRDQYIPRTLDQVFDIERDAEKVQRGEAHDLVYQSLLASNKEDVGPSNVTNGNAPVDANDEDAANASSEDEDEEDSEEEHEGEEKRPRGKRFEDKSAKKDHKAAVKEEKREKRKTKLPKKEKKRLVNSSSRGRRK